MGKKVYLGYEEPISCALMRLRFRQRFEYKRWTKKRYGYYEKPSALRRKRLKMAKHWQNRSYAIPGWRNDYKKHDRQNCSHLYIGLTELFARTGPTNAAGR